MNHILTLALCASALLLQAPDLHAQAAKRKPAGAASTAASKSPIPAKNFDGLSATINVAQTTTSTEILNGTPSTDRGSKPVADVQFHYSHALTDRLLIGGGLTFGMRLEAGRIGGQQIRIEDRYSIDIVPGYAISKDWMLYGRLSSLSANSVNQSVDRTTKLGGWGYGLGARTKLEKDTFLQFGYNLYNYDTATDSVSSRFQHSAREYFIGMGMTF